MKYLAIIFILFLFSCNSNQSNTEKEQSDSTKLDSETSDNSQLFRSYLNNFKKVELPITIKGCNLSAEQLHGLEGGDFEKFVDNSSMAYGQLQTNGNYIATITLGAADCFIPVLTTYTPNGQIIDKQTIAIGGCGFECGFTCEEFMSIKKDLTIYTSDTISTYTCDDSGNETPGTYEYYVIFKKGKLLPDGKIVMSNEEKQPLKGRKK